MDESNSATSATDGLPSRQQQQEQVQQEQQQQLTQPPRGAHLLTSTTTKSHRQATNEALAADDSSTPSGQEEKTSFMCFPISRISHIRSNMSFFWSRKREEPKDAPTSPSMEPPSHQPQTSSHPKDSNSNTMEDTIVDFDALYREERKGFLKDFKGKKPRIEEQFHQFWEHPNAEEDATAYLQNDEAHVYPKIPKWVQGKTIFTNFQDKEKILAEDEEVLISSNHASFDIAQYPGNSSPAGMSMIHLLGLPKKSIYNGVALDKDNVQVIDKIMNLFKSSWSDRRFREQVLKHQGDAIDRQFQAAMGKANEKSEAEATKGRKLADEGHELAKKHHEGLGGKIHNLDVDGFQFGLHLYPDHSIPHFHMHIVAMHPGMREYSTSQHDEKTKDAEEVRGAVMAFDRKTRTFDKSWVANTT